MAQLENFEKVRATTIADIPIVDNNILLKDEPNIISSRLDNILSTKRESIINFDNIKRVRDEITISELDETMNFTVLDTYARKFRTIFDPLIKDIGKIKNLDETNEQYTETIDKNYQGDKVPDIVENFSMGGFLSNNKMELGLGVLITILVIYTNAKGN